MIKVNEDYAIKESSCNQCGKKGTVWMVTGPDEGVNYLCKEHAEEYLNEPIVYPNEMI